MNGNPATPAPGPQRNHTESVRGVLERIIFFNEENHYCIAELRDDNESRSITVTGAMPNVQCGEYLHLTGQWTHHPRHGEQFKVQTLKSELPATVYGIRRYLGSGLVPGIGKVYANKIVDHFRADTFRIISEESGRLRDIPGIGKERARAIKSAWEEQKAVREIMVFLQTYGVSPAQCVRLVKKYGNEAQEILRNDPYRIAREIPGIGFKTADRIAINLGFANESPPRLAAGLLHVMAEFESEGHTAFPESEFLVHTAELLEANPAPLKEALETLVKDRHLVRLPEQSLVQLPATHRAEGRIAETLARLEKCPGGLPPIKIDKAIEWAQERAGFAFSPHQTEALRQALSRKVTVLTGGPGTGKTSILRALNDILRAKNAVLRMAAPTGRAAQRLAESTGGTAQTIHRLLKFDPSEGAFTVNSERPLKADFVIVDESSMLDTRLAADLLQAIPSKAHLLLVGDTDQLPSVGAGNVLKDVIQSGIASVTRLRTIYRQSEKSGIVETAHAVKAGQAQPPAMAPSADEIDEDADLQFIEAPTPEAALDALLRLCTETLPRLFRIDPVRDLQVLSPMHKGIAGVANLNASLQQALNPTGPALTHGGIAYRPGDKLIQLRNNYEKNLFNGDLGTITAVDNEAGALSAEFEGERHDFERADLNDLSLAYAITIHKSQGSEYPVIVMLLLKQHYMMLRRNLVYTGITRGRKKVFLIGDPTAYAMAVRNNQTAERHTFLQQRIRNLTS